jgi:RIO kinase 1
MGTGLEHLLAEGVISEVLARLQSGKEAEVYVVLFGGKVVAAKVYKDRATRSFKNNSEYKEGRAVRNSRSQRAIDRGSKFGKSAAEDAWKTAEADALYKLHAAEVRVPTPVLYLDGVLLMDTDLTVSDANAAYHDMIGQLVRILACDLIHGDLSPYNVLWAAAGPTIIDFPQIISASHNSSSERFFLRDADNILGHFARIDRSLQSRHGDPWEIWQAYRRRELTPDFRPSGRPARPAFVAPRAATPPGARPPHAPQAQQAPRGGGQRPRERNDRPPTQQHAQGQHPQGQHPQGPRRGGHGGQAPRGPAPRSGPEVMVRRPSIASPAMQPQAPSPSTARPPSPPPPHLGGRSPRASRESPATSLSPRSGEGSGLGPTREAGSGEGERPAHRRRRRRR